MLVCSHARSDGPFDENVRAKMLKHSDGRVAHVETEYNTLLIDKHGSLLGLTTMFQWRPDYSNRSSISKTLTPAGLIHPDHAGGAHLSRKRPNVF